MSEREAWLNIVKPAELEMHMASIGQAETNATIVKEMFVRFPLGQNAKLLIHGCGSCQMFDYMNISDLGNANLIFADLSPGMLEEAKRRLARVSERRFDVVVDDLEHSTIAGRYDAVLLVLVLLHVDWKESLQNMIRLGPSRFYIIEQEQTPGVSPVTTRGRLLPSMEQYSKVADMKLVSREELVAFMNDHGYGRAWHGIHPVPGGKAMAGLVFQRHENSRTQEE